MTHNYLYSAKQKPVKVLMWSCGYVVPEMTDDSEWWAGHLLPRGHWHRVLVFTSSTSGLFRTVNRRHGSLR